MANQKDYEDEEMTVELELEVRRGGSGAVRASSREKGKVGAKHAGRFGGSHEIQRGNGLGGVGQA